MEDLERMAEDIRWARLTPHQRHVRVQIRSLVGNLPNLPTLRQALTMVSAQAVHRRGRGQALRRQTSGVAQR